MNVNRHKMHLLAGIYKVHREHLHFTCQMGLCSVSPDLQASFIKDCTCCSKEKKSPKVIPLMSHLENALDLFSFPAFTLSANISLPRAHFCLPLKMKHSYIECYLSRGSTQRES